MSAKKQIIVVSMVFIAVAIGLIFAISAKGGATIESRLEDAQTYFDMLDYDKAIAIYNNLLNSEKKCVEAYIGLADAYIVKGNNDKAIEVLERGLSNVDNDPRIAKKLSEISGILEENNFAEADLSEPSVVDEITESDIPQTTSVPEAPASDTETSVPVQTAEAASEVTTTVQTTTAATTTRAPETTAATTRATTVQTTTAAATTVTTAKPTIEVPNFIGVDKDEAVKLADKMKIKLNLQYDKNDMYANNVIYYQSHRAGTMVSEQTIVDVYVCVNDQKQVSEEDTKVQEFYNAAKAWGDSNSDKVKSVTLSEKNATVTVAASSLKKFVVDESVAEAFSKCKNAVLVVKSSSLTITINSSSVSKAAKIDLSANTYGNDSRVSLEMGASGSLNCTASITLADCDISSSDLDSMKLYYNNKKSGTFSVNSDGKPVLTVSNGGQYVIK